MGTFHGIQKAAHSKWMKMLPSVTEKKEDKIKLKEEHAWQCRFMKIMVILEPTTQRG